MVLIPTPQRALQLTQCVLAYLAFRAQVLWDNTRGARLVLRTSLAAFLVGVIAAYIVAANEIFGTQAFLLFLLLHISLLLKDWTAHVHLTLGSRAAHSQDWLNCVGTVSESRALQISS